MNHTQAKLLQCNICHKSFKFESVLEMPTKAHNDQKLYQCNSCYKSSEENSDLKLLHLTTHTGESLHQYSLFEKGFPQNCDLNNQLATHTVEKNISVQPV